MPAAATGRDDDEDVDIRDPGGPRLVRAANRRIQISEASEGGRG